MTTLTKSEMFDVIVDYLGVFEVDLKTGNINWATKTLEKMFGYSIPGDLEGRSIDTLVPEALRERHQTAHRPAFAANPEPRLMGRKYALSGQRQDGTVFPVEVMILPKAVNRVRVVVGIVFDMSARTEDAG